MQTNCKSKLKLVVKINKTVYIRIYLSYKQYESLGE